MNVVELMVPTTGNGITEVFRSVVAEIKEHVRQKTRTKKVVVKLFTKV